jgi:hypothetical protein
MPPSKGIKLVARDTVAKHVSLGGVEWAISLEPVYVFEITSVTMQVSVATS